MERGLYAAASAMLAQQTMQETLAQNIANASTVGYKQDGPTFRAVHGMMLQRVLDGSGSGPNVGELGLGVAPDQIYTDMTQGALMQTGNPLDASLGPNQFFTVQTPQGVRYTRAGNFQLDANGTLKTPSGYAVLDNGGRPITTGGQRNIALDTNGNVTANGRPIAQLGIVQTQDTNMTKAGDSLFTAKDPNAIQTPARPAINPGTLEQSNVNPVLSLVQMITTSRGFEMAQKALTTQDDLIRQASNDLGKV